MAFADFHTHTLFSDGTCTVRDMVDAARKGGLLALGISDHSYTPFDPHYCLRPEAHAEKYEATVREEQKIARERYGFPVLLGIEWDYCSQLDPADYDYTIGSVHYVLRHGEWFAVDNGAACQQAGIDSMFGGNRLDFAKAYFEEVVAHAARNKPTFIGHFDLLTKHGLINERDPAYLAVAREALTETVKHVPLFEINVGAISRGYKTEPYPHPVLLPELCRLGGRVILSSDAHQAEGLAFMFPEALKLLQRAGFTKVSRLTAGGIVEDEISSLL